MRGEIIVIYPLLFEGDFILFKGVQGLSGTCQVLVRHQALAEKEKK